MGACAIYTAIPDTQLVEEVLACGDPAARVETASIEARGWHRFGLGRLAVMALAEAFTPASHLEVVCALHRKGSYGAFTPAAAHYTGPPVFDDVAPHWPRSPALAAIIGCAPARYHGWPRRSSAGVAILERDLVGASLDELRTRDPRTLASHDLVDTRAIAQSLIEWLTAAHARRDHVMIHWELG